MHSTKSFTVNQVSKKVGVARSTLLYYERQGLIKPGRHQENKYRLYSADDINRLVMLRQLQKAGLSLIQCRQMLDGRLKAEILEERLSSLNDEITALRKTEALLKALLQRTDPTRSKNPNSDHTEKNWHLEFEKQSPEAHAQWLIQQGYSEKESLHIRWVSKQWKIMTTICSAFSKSLKI